MAVRRSLLSRICRSLHSLPSPTASSTPLRTLPLLAVSAVRNLPALFSTHSNPTSSGHGYSPLNDASPNWTNRPPKETILLDGCDYEHWLVVMEFPEDNNKPSEEQMIESYVKTLSSVVGSEEEAKKKIYSVCTTTYTGFGALISEELSEKLKELPGVLWVLPDSYLDVPNKDYGGDLLVDGKVIHRPQFNFKDRQQTGNRQRPRHDRRRETMQVERRRESGTFAASAYNNNQRRNVPSDVPQEEGGFQGGSSGQGNY